MNNSSSQQRHQLEHRHRHLRHKPLRTSRRRYSSNLAAALLGCVCIALAQSTPSHAFKECLKEDRRRKWQEPCEKVDIHESFHHLADPMKQLRESSQLTCSNAAAAESSNSNSDDNGTCDSQNNRNTIGNSDIVSSEYNERKDACSYVTAAIFAENPMYDAVLLHQGMCDGGIAEGTFGPHDALRLLPNNQELMSLMIYGRDLAKAIATAIHHAYHHNARGSFPTTAGMRYKYQLVGEDIHVSDVQFLSASCGWQDIQFDQVYTVLTNRHLLDHHEGYRALQAAVIKQVTGNSEAHTFWSHTQSLCRLETKEAKAARRLREAEAEALASYGESKMVHHVGCVNSQHTARSRPVFSAGM